MDRALVNVVFENSDGETIAERQVNFNYIAQAIIVQFEGKLYVYNPARQQSLGGLRKVSFCEVDDPVEIT
ncbi:hypothetical protein D3C87_324820 [compost metagenome]